MNRYDETIGQNKNSEDTMKYSLTSEQIDQLNEKYDLLHMTCEEEELLMKDLNEIGILTKEECSSYLISEGNILESLSKQVSSDIKLLYQMAIAGRDSGSHIEHMKSQQKILGILEQLLAG